MGKWLISTLTEETWEEWRGIYYHDQQDPFKENHGGHFRGRILIYDDERNEFSDQIKYFHPWLQMSDDHDLGSPTFCNARTIYKGYDPEEDCDKCVVEPLYPDQTILSDLWPEEAIPENRIRYFVIYKRILDDENKTETYKIVGNDETIKDIGLQELNTLLENGKIINREYLNGKLPVYYAAQEEVNKEKIMRTVQRLDDYSRAMGITYPLLDYVFLGDEVIVTGINEKWLDEQERTPVIKELCFPDGVTKIADGAFMTGDREVHILKVILKPTIKEIGGFAFFGREELTSVVFSRSKDFSGSQEFNVARLKKIGEYAFYGCKKLKLELNVFPEFTEFENGVFYECNSVNVKYIETPKVHRIGMLAFKGTTVSMEFPGALKEIDAYAFSDSKLENKNIIIPDSVTTLEDFSFAGCDLSTVVLPKNLTTLSNFLFEGSKLIQLPRLPESLKEIGICCFRDCSEMTGTIKLPETLEYIGMCAFEHTALVKADLTSKLKRIPDFIFKHCVDLQEVKLPEEITTIGYESFCNCKSLPEIDIPSSVHSIFSRAFLGCAKLDKVEYDPELLLHLGSDAFMKEVVEDFWGDICPGKSKVKISVDPLKKGDLVILMDPIDYSGVSEKYGIFDHMTKGNKTKANVWLLPWLIENPYAIDSENIEPETLQPDYQEMNSGIHKVIYDEENIMQRISREYLLKRYKIDVTDNLR